MAADHLGVFRVRSSASSTIRYSHSSRRMILRARPVRWGIALGVAAGLVPGPALADHGFGANPMDSVIAQAGDANRCAALSKNHLAAMMMSPTWEEAAASSYSPSPMTMSRYDRQQNLYSFGTVGDHERAFWHPGVGMWQLDDAGLGAFMSANQRVNTPSAANKAANTMASRFCSASGSNAERRAYAWSPWYACSDGSCEPRFNHIYCSGTDTVCNIDRNPNVSNDGGMQIRTCRFEGNITDSFTCWFLHIAGAEGYTDLWQAEPKTGSSSISPLSYAFYTWQKRAPDPDKDVRAWIRDDTGYQIGEIRAKRTDGTNSRTGLNWSDVPSGYKLCDIDARKGVCS